MDYAASTPLDKEVFDQMQPYLFDLFGNANSQHGYGREGEAAVMNARERIAHAIGAKLDNEILFTSGGTEADNWAVKGFAGHYKHRGNHIITTAIEHAAILEPLKQLEGQGFEVTYLPVDSDGLVSVESLKAALTDKTIFVSIMAANNEIGTVLPIKELAKAAHDYNSKIIFHTDAVQALGSIPVDVQDWGVDSASISSHKVYGPKGVGALYVRKGIKLDRLIAGGHQERNLRGGTTNVPGVVGFGAAAAKAVKDLERNSKYIAGLRDKLVSRVMAEVSDVKYNGHKTLRLPGNANFSFSYVEGEGILLRLDMDGVAVSSGSACSSGSLDPSHVLLAIGVPIEVAHGSIRFSLGKFNTEDDIDYAVEALKKTLGFLRAMSPLIVNIKGETHYV